MKNGFRPSKRVPIDPLERAEENARAYQDLARAEARRLPEYEPDDEESTARHDVPPQKLIVENHVHMHSEPDHDRDSGLPELPKKGPWRWLALALGTIVAAVLTWLSGKIGAK